MERRLTIAQYLGLFADQNENAGPKRHKIQQKNGWTQIQTESQQPIDNQINPEQKHTYVFGDLHDLNPEDFFASCQSLKLFIDPKRAIA